MSQIIEFLSSPVGVALLTVLLPLLLSKMSPTVAKIVYSVLGALGIKIPVNISNATWEGLGMERHAPTAEDKALDSFDALICSARASLQAGNLENAQLIMDLASKRAAETLRGDTYATSK